MIGRARLRAFSSLLTDRKLVGFLLIGILLVSCSGHPIRGSQARGVYHRVKSGETLSVIAKAYHIDVQELAEVNNIRKSDEITVGSVVFIPDATQVLDDVLAESRSQRTSATGAAAPETRAAATGAASQKEIPKKTAAAVGGQRGERASDAVAKDRAALARAAERDMASRRTSEKTQTVDDGERTAKKRDDDGTTGEIRFDRKRFIWPVSGKVVTKFGTESITTDFNGRKIETAKIMNNGIKIAAGIGAPVIAAGAGKVIYSMLLERFGNTIIIEHDDDFKTVYYNLGKRLVETSRKVKRGDPIAYMGESGAAKGEAYMNFEIRQRNKPRNPLFFLP
jgi:lipoprotein NlpD